MSLFSLNKAIIEQLKPHLNGVKFSAEDLEEPIIRPSIKVTMENTSFGRVSGSLTERSLTVRLYFFATKDRKNKSENVAMQEIIESAFVGGLMVDDVLIPIESIDSDVTDGVLVSSFDLVVGEIVAEDPGSGENMEELDLTFKEGE